jgi:hypothetical protein
MASMWMFSGVELLPCGCLPEFEIASMWFLQEFEIDPESDSDQVDELLSLCLKQALSQAKGSSEDSSSNTAGATPQ